MPTTQLKSHKQLVNANQLKKWMFPWKYHAIESKIAERYGFVQERMEFPRRDLARMLNDLAEISPEEMGIHALSKDPLYARLQGEGCLELVRRAVDCGNDCAEWIMGECGGQNAQQILFGLGIETRYLDIPAKTGRILFAEFVEPNEVNIYLDAVNRVEHLAESEGVQKVLTPQLDIRDAIFAHELFHVLEMHKKDSIFTQTYRHQLWRVGPFKNFSKIIALGEIAAMSFAQKFCGLPYSLYILNVLLLYGYSEREASGLYEEMMIHAGKKPYHTPCLHEDTGI